MTAGAAAAQRHLAALAAEPRPAGGPAEARARAYCSEHLSALGCVVHAEPFSYSALPGRIGTPAAGVALMGMFLAAGAAGMAGRPGAALLVLVIGGVLLGAAGSWAAKRGVLDLPVLRTQSMNLLAVRGAPRVWLVAHLDSKSQPVPIGVRAAGITVSALAWAAGVVLAVTALVRGAGAAGWPWLAAAGVVSAIPVAASLVGTASPGALDNASGVAAVLRAAELVPGATALGVLLTSAEELGLAGARAWARGRPPLAAINFDGIDDSGTLRLAHGGRGGGELLRRLLASAASLAIPCVARRLPPGILVDGVALADNGWEVVTVSKGTPGTLARIHGPRDTLERLTGGGVEEAARLAARTVEAFT